MTRRTRYGLGIAACLTGYYALDWASWTRSPRPESLGSVLLDSIPLGAAIHLFIRLLQLGIRDD